MPSVHYHYDKFPPVLSAGDLGSLFSLVGEARAALAEYAGLLKAIPNPDVLLSPLTHNEAVLSSRIEGTQVTLGEVLDYEAEGNLTDESTPQKADIHEVLNYRAALKTAPDLLKKLPLSQRLIKTLHRTLMRGVRGRNKNPGEYRKVPNWIGPDGCSIEEARFIPCSADKLPAAMGIWEEYLHSREQDPLLQLALAHAEFEALHPFLDGNGRLGRMLIPLFLYEKGLLEYPNFYMSEYLERNRDEYYRRLLDVSRKNDWTGWCAFFFRGVTEQARTNGEKATAIFALYEQKKAWAQDALRSQHAIRALDWFFNKPIFKTTDFIETAGIPAPTARRLLRDVKEAGMLVELRPASGRTAAILKFPELLNIAEGYDAF